MGTQTQKKVSGSTVRIWTKSKERLAEVVKEKSEREGRIVSEAELVSKAVNMLCAKEEKKLGIV